MGCWGLPETLGWKPEKGDELPSVLPDVSVPCSVKSPGPTLSSYESLSSLLPHRSLSFPTCAVGVGGGES